MMTHAQGGGNAAFATRPRTHTLGDTRDAIGTHRQLAMSSKNWKTVKILEELDHVGVRNETLHIRLSTVALKCKQQGNTTVCNI